MAKPLVPKACDLTDFAFMPVDVRRLLNSETWILGSAEERAASMTLWLESWQQVPAGSIPANDKLLAHLSLSGSKWAKVKEHVLRGWVLCDDGRYYHPVVAEKALEAWIEKLYAAISGNSGNAKRWGIAIDSTELESNLSDAVVRLKTLAPRSKALNKKIVKIVESQSQGDSPTVSGGDSGGDRNREGEGEGEGYREDNINKKGEQAFLKADEAKALWIPELDNLNELMAEKNLSLVTQAELDNQIVDFNRHNAGKDYTDSQRYGFLRTWITRARDAAKPVPRPNKSIPPAKPDHNPPQRQTDTTKQRERTFDEYHDDEVYSQCYTAGLIRRAMTATETPEQCMYRLTKEKLGAKTKAGESCE